MARFFTGGGSDRVTVTSTATNSNVNVGTMIARVRPASVTPNNYRELWHKGTNDSPGGVARRFAINDSNQLEFWITRGTAQLEINVALANLPGAAANEWGVWAVRWDTGAADGAQQAFGAVDGQRLAEATAYATQTAGSGTPGDESAASATVGGHPSGIAAWGGALASFLWFNRYLSLEEIDRYQLGLQIPTPAHGLILWYELGQTVSGPEVDYSGRGHTGTVTGTFRFQHPTRVHPFNDWRPESDGYDAAPAAPTGVVPSVLERPTWAVRPLSLPVAYR